MKKKYLAILIAIITVVSIAYAEYHFTHTVDNGQALSEESFWMESERLYFVYVHGDNDGVLQLHVKDMDGTTIWSAPYVVYDNTKYFTVPETGYYTCTTRNFTTGANQHMHADWQDTN